MSALERAPRRPRVLVTGASRGIGRATALALARTGHDLVVTARTEPQLASLAKELRALGARAQPLVMDVTDADSVRVAVAAALAEGPIDVLVNNAGIAEQRLFLAQDAAYREHEMNVNYFGAQRVTAAVLPHMIARRRGTLVNVSSVLGEVPCPSTANYSGTKAALAAWSHALRGEIAHHGVRVVVFVPSHTATEAADQERFDGVYTLPLEYTVSQLLRAIRRAPRTWVTSPVFAAFVRLAHVFPAWGEARMVAATRSIVRALPG